MTNNINRLITAPKVHAVAWSVINPAGLADWSVNNDLSEKINDINTPLGKIADSVVLESHGVTPRYSSLDLIPEFAGRFCYHSWTKGRETSEYYDNIRSEGHGSILEHSSITLAISGVSRSLTHELVRHRAGFAISQESQRYVTASNVKFVVPPILLQLWDGLEDGYAVDWLASQMNALVQYENDKAFIEDTLKEEGFTGTTARKRANVAARASLPNACETKLVWTGNFRSLRHFLAVRGGAGADLEIRRLALAILEVCKQKAPESFKDIQPYDHLDDDDFGYRVIDSENPKV